MKTYNVSKDVSKHYFYINEFSLKYLREKLYILKIKKKINQNRIFNLRINYENLLNLLLTTKNNFANIYLK